MKSKNFRLIILLAFIAIASTSVVTVKADDKVGTPHGEFAVSQLGAATYSVEIECPKGVGGMEPKIAITYNSQSGYGLVGYGTTISGISSITIGGRDHYHDSFTKGLLYDGHDSFYLDGKRLLADTARYLPDAMTYTIEGDPYMTVTAHGTLNDQTANLWFEVHDRNGMTYKYGETSNSRLGYTNNSGKPRINAWYVSSVEDAHTNYMSYTYEEINYTIRPHLISYGGNRTAGTSHCNTISFTYESLGNTAQPFVIEDQQGNISFRLKNITAKTDNSTYRSYALTYDTNSDGSLVKFTRLTGITEWNGHSDTLRPITLEWNNLLNANVTSSNLNINLDDDDPLIEKQDMNLLSADLNGDGVDDIIRVSQVKIYFDSSHTACQYKTCVYVSRSQVGANGNVTYSSPLRYFYDSQISWDEYQYTQGGTSVVDYDGDGLNDLLIPFYKQFNDSRRVIFSFIFGKDVAIGNTQNAIGFNAPLTASYELPLIVSYDVSNDGFDDIIYLEKDEENGSYPLRIIYPTGTDMQHDSIRFDVVLPNAPRKMFAGDYNRDGLTDIIIFHDSGYKIYFNRGGGVSEQKFYEWAKATGTNVKNSWRMVQGDFNADGVPDFVVNEQNEWGLHFALGNSDGSFTYQQATTLPVVDKNTGRDDERYNIQVMDMDNDGRSDVVVLKEDLEYHGGFENYYEFTETYVGWFRSNGETLEQLHTQWTSGIDDANQRYATVGDFDGDGSPELLHFGKNIYGTSYVDETKLHIYKTGTSIPSRGRVKKITDGLGRTTAINYVALSDTAVYRNTGDLTYPVVERRIPLSVVKSVTRSNGVAGNNTTYYQYQGLKIHTKGKGLLGFSGTTVKNDVFNTRVESTVEQWDADKWIPTRSRIVNRTGDGTMTNVTNYGVITVNNNPCVHSNFFVYPQTVTKTDEYGNVTITASTVDATTGMPLTVNQSSDAGTYYKNTVYADYIKKGGRYLPQSVTTTQKHPDDASTWTDEDAYTYNDKGQPIVTVKHNGTSKILMTQYSYDDFGNILSEVSSGNNVTSVSLHKVYDSRGRFVSSEYTTPATSQILYTRDTWGNVTQKQEIGSSTWTTSYVYDSWGDLYYSNSPEGIETYYSEGRGVPDNNNYWKMTSTSGRPYVMTWYDNEGREIQTQTIGPNHTVVSKTVTYNMRGKPSYITSTSGELTINEQLSYDSRGRLVADTLSTGRNTTYCYGNRLVTSTENGHAYTKTYDAWGNVKTSIDPVSSVNYSYYSSGLPKSAASEGNIISMNYDQAGHRTLIDDPDAGETASTWSADGKLMTQTDARGVETVNTYTSLGCLSTQTVGDQTITYTYGTNASDKLRLQSTSLNGNTIEYGYDTYNRVISETRSFYDGTNINYAYSYNNRGHLSQTVYPGGLTVGYTYDDFGNLTQMTANGQTVYSHKYFDGRKDSVLLLGTIGYTSLYDVNGNLDSQTWSRNDTVINNKTYDIDGATGNLLRRSLGHPWGNEYYTYDALDRLKTIERNSDDNDTITYSPDGNILRKNSAGDYYYNNLAQPHAVKEITNSGSTWVEDLETTFGDLNRIETVEQGAKRTTFDYGPDGQRWRTVMERNDTVKRTILYGGDYERVAEGGVIREFYYLGHDIIVMKQNGTFTPLVAMTDHLGSILRIVDANGNNKFDAEYDAWGDQTIYKNTIAFHRGYTGHEMLNDYGLVNMNGRLYDPQIGRFLSPDNYIQQPDNSQSFNRYSYCLNNPLKYTDPDGEWFGIDDLFASIVGGVVNLTTNLIQGNVHNIWQGVSYFCVGAIAGEVTLYSGFMAPYVSAGILGIGNDVLSQGFEKGFNHVDGWQTLQSFAMSEIIASVGVQLDHKLGQSFNRIISKLAINNTAVNQIISQTLQSSASGAIIGGLFSLTNGTDLSDLGKNVLNGALNGAAIGLIYSSAGIIKTTFNQSKSYDNYLEIIKSLDLEETIIRIENNQILIQYPHDGSIFHNNLKILPDGYIYREWVVPTSGLPSNRAGTQRIVTSDGGWYYTPDHYDTFIRIR